MRQPKLYEYNGEVHSAEEWAAIKNIKLATLRRRLRRGWTIEESLERPLCRGHYTKNYLITYQGETKELWMWGKELNMPYTVVYKRYKYGWSAEDILERPVRAKRRKNSLCNMDCFNCKFDDCISE